MRRTIFFSAIALATLGLIVLSACSNQQTGSKAYGSPATTPVKSAISPTWVQAQVSGDAVSIPVAEVKKDTIVHFKISTAVNDESFMAYIFNGTTYVRANICPPCLSESFSLVKTTLVCDTCGTVFDAKTGAGISGPCVRYPKAAVNYKTASGNLVMTVADLEAAYQNTLIPKKP